jgi:hypothetical protein
VRLLTGHDIDSIEDDQEEGKSDEEQECWF